MGIPKSQQELNSDPSGGSRIKKLPHRMAAIRWSWVGSRGRTVWCQGGLGRLYGALEAASSFSLNFITHLIRNHSEFSLEDPHYKSNCKILQNPLWGLLFINSYLKSISNPSESSLPPPPPFLFVLNRNRIRNASESSLDAASSCSINFNTNLIRNPSELSLEAASSFSLNFILEI